MDKYDGIGVFDSGVGGLTVASKIAKMLPNERIFYFGDTAHVPYGDKSEVQIIGYVHNIIDFLIKKNVKALVMACNTSSAIVLPRLNGNLSVPVMGVIEYAAKRAATISANGRVGIVANPVTVRSSAYEKSIKEFSNNAITVHQQACPRWVPLIESGKTSGKEVENVVREDLQSLIDANIDTLILGCTHYPYFAPTIKKILPRNVCIIDPAEAVISQLKQVLEDSNLLSDAKKPKHSFFVSGNAEEFRLKGSWFFGQWINKICKVDLDNLVPTEICLSEELRSLAVAL
jgi:glutamate racemase